MLIDEAPEDYEVLDELARTGEFGAAESTKAGKKAAINHFNGFLEFESRGEEFAFFAHMNSTDACDLSRLQRFATYLMKVARDDRGDLLRPGTCLQYFSGKRSCVSLNITAQIRRGEQY